MTTLWASLSARPGLPDRDRHDLPTSAGRFPNASPIGGPDLGAPVPMPLPGAAA